MFTLLWQVNGRWFKMDSNALKRVKGGYLKWFWSWRIIQWKVLIQLAKIQSYSSPKRNSRWTKNEQVKVIKTRRLYHLYFLEVGDVCSMNVSNGLKTEPCVNQSPVRDGASGQMRPWGSRMSLRGAGRKKGQDLNYLEMSSFLSQLLGWKSQA